MSNELHMSAGCVYSSPAAGQQTANHNPSYSFPLSAEGGQRAGRQWEIFMLGDLRGREACNPSINYSRISHISYPHEITYPQIHTYIRIHKLYTHSFYTVDPPPHLPTSPTYRNGNRGLYYTLCQHQLLSIAHRENLCNVISN